MELDIFLALSLSLGLTFGAGDERESYGPLDLPIRPAMELNMFSSPSRDARVSLEISHLSDAATHRDRGVNTIMLKGSAILWGNTDHEK